MSYRSVLLALSLPLSLGRAQTPTVQQILDRYVAAIGGREAILATTSSTMRGSVVAPAIGAQGTIALYAKAPNKQLTDFAGGVMGTWQVGYDGSMGWRRENGETKDIARYPVRDAEFHQSVKMLELYPKLTVAGNEKIGTRDAWCIEAPRAGNPRRWCFDAASGLKIRMEDRNAKGEVVSREDYDDHRAVSGVMVPFVVRALDPSGVEVVITYSEVRFNVALDDKLFARPGAELQAGSAR